MHRIIGALTALSIATLAVSCTSSGAGGREVTITQRDDGCTPTRIEATAGEKLKLVVKNESGDDYEVEGIDGTKLEEVVVPKGRTRTPGYSVPDGGGTFKIKCYVPAGTSTIIEIVAGAGGGPESTISGDNEPGGVSGPADDTVQVDLHEYTITPDKASVSAGAIKFVAANNGTAVHELAVLKKNADGSLDNQGEIEDVDPGKGGEVILKLEPGDYELACVIVPGEAGSKVDHYQQGMLVAFTVTE